jgi:8-oxo-dGTP diphosphatase
MNTKVTTDAIIVENNKILLIKRAIDPFKGKWALPGGHLEYGETTEKCVIREVQEETGLEVGVIKLLGVYSDPGRDPRGHTVTVIYLCKAEKGEAHAGDDAAETWWFPLDDLPEMAFDHARIVKDSAECGI